MVFSKRYRALFSLIRQILLAFYLIAVLSANSQAQTLGFETAFGSNMVLPHGRSFSLSGHAAPETALTLEVDGARYSFRSDAAGRWQTEIAPLSAGGPYQVRLRSSRGDEAVLDNVLAGDVWLCSGQSNMAYPVAASIDQPGAYNQGHPAIRLLSVPLRTELNALEDFKEPSAWQTATDSSVKNFSAVCYFFARQRVEQDGIPLGLINASWGGSAIEAWVSERTLSGIADYGRKVDQLRQYRHDRRKAELAFADDWMRWWQEHSDQGAVWKQGVLDPGADWREAPLQNWKTYPDERLKNHHGIVWFSRSFELTAEQQAKKATFVLGKIDEVDSTWINGKFVNNTFGYGTKREYPLDPGVLQMGVNQITVNVLNTWDVGGMLGPVDEVGLRFDDGEFLPLGAGWRYRFIPRETGQPPRSPWESVSGITGMFNGMISPLKPLQPAGAIWYQGESNTESSHTYRSLLSALVRDWRLHFNRQFPFIIVQLPNYGAVAAAPVESGWAAIRNAQQQVALEDPQAGLVVTHDVGDDVDIHPRRKWIVGVRAAHVAQALRGGGAADGVTPSIIGRDSESVVLDFSPPLQFGDKEKEVAGFSLCPESGGGCKSAEAAQTGGRIKINLDALPNAGRLRYCWSDGGQCELKALNGLPVSSFELNLPGKDRAVHGQTDRKNEPVSRE
ncbi:MAG: beta galactosidase jelly roll domain-containing protein [Acidobacteria bacterium]|nr:beta galactosidase jelly roll domain-containing protein [Acidobacteriota bacterium]